MDEINNLIEILEKIIIFIVIAYITQFIANLIIILKLPKICRYLKEYFYEEGEEYYEEEKEE